MLKMDNNKVISSGSKTDKINKILAKFKNIKILSKTKNL